MSTSIHLGEYISQSTLTFLEAISIKLFIHVKENTKCHWTELNVNCIGFLCDGYPFVHLNYNVMSIVFPGKTH